MRIPGCLVCLVLKWENPIYYMKENWRLKMIMLKLEKSEHDHAIFSGKLTENSQTMKVKTLGEGAGLFLCRTLDFSTTGCVCTLQLFVCVPYQWAGGQDAETSCRARASVWGCAATWCAAGLHHWESEEMVLTASWLGWLQTPTCLLGSHGVFPGLWNGKKERLPDSSLNTGIITTISPAED